MKKFAFLLLIFTLTSSFAQKQSIESKKEFKVTSVSYTVNSLVELEKIDWTDVKEVFSSNKDEEKIEMSFGVDFKKSKSKFKSSVTVSGESKNIDSLIVRAKKAVKAIIKISKNYKQ